MIKLFFPHINVYLFLDYLYPLYKNVYTINGTQPFPPQYLANLPPYQDGKEDVS